MKADPGYPAFAAWSPDGAQSGLSTRAYYAAAALPSVLIMSKRMETPDEIARRCFEIADAMVKKEMTDADH